MSLELKASILAAKGRKTDAHDEFAKAAQAERNLGYLFVAELYSAGGRIGSRRSAFHQ